MLICKLILITFLFQKTGTTSKKTPPKTKSKLKSKSDRNIRIHNSTKIRSKIVKCRHCELKFPCRSEWYSHNKKQHGSGLELQPAPWLKAPYIAPWVDNNGDENLIMKECFEISKDEILKSHNEGILITAYNFPTPDLSGGVEEIISRLDINTASKMSLLK